MFRPVFCYDFAIATRQVVIKGAHDNRFTLSF